MPKSRIPSPARSQGAATTPKRKRPHGSRSVCSPALSTASGRLTSLIDQFKDKNMASFALSPLNGRSVLNDNTDIEEPRRKSWWKKLDENSQDIMEVLDDPIITNANNAIEDLIDIEVLSQEKKNFTLDLPESSDNESINSIVLPQRRLFTQKENQPQKKFGQLVGNRETLAKLHKPNTTTNIETVNIGTRQLFQNTKKSKPIFPAALLNISPNKTTADKTKENILVDPKPQIRNIFGNRPTNKRKNMFADFIVSESEDEIPDIQPKVFGFQKKPEQRRISSVSRGRDPSPTSSITTDMEMDEWKLLPSSTMVENQLEDMVAGHTPIKRPRLSKLSEAKESEAGTMQTNTTVDKTKQSNKSASSKNKSKSSPEIKERSLNNSRTTRSMLKNASKLEDNVNSSRKHDTKNNKSQSKTSDKDNALNVSSSKSKDNRDTTVNKSQKQNKSRTRNSPNIIEEEIISNENNVVNAINNETGVINKSTKKLSNSTVIHKSRDEDNIEINIKQGGDKINRSSSSNIEPNDQEDDENNFTLEYEIEDNENIDQVAVQSQLHKSQKQNIKNQNTIVLEKDSEEDGINISKNKSLRKSAKIIEESVDSQQNEQHSADDNVDGNLEKVPGIKNEKHSENKNNVTQGALNKSKENKSEQIDDEINIIQKDRTNENEEEVNVIQENEEDETENKDKNKEKNGKVNVSDKNEEEVSISQENEQLTTKTEVNEDEVRKNEGDEGELNESETDEAVNLSQENDDETHEKEIANQSQVVEDENDNESNAEDPNQDETNVSQEIRQEIEEHANDSQEMNEECKSKHEVKDDIGTNEEAAYEGQESNESQNEENKEYNVSANESQEVENEEENQEEDDSANESQEVENEEETQEDDVSANDSQEVENEEETQDDDVSANDSQEVENEEENEGDYVSANESQEVENEEESQEVESDADASESAEIEQDELDDSAEADKAIATDAEMSEQDDDNLADEMEVDDDVNTQESDEEINENEQDQDESQEDGQFEEQNDVEISAEEIEESPNVTHDTTGRHRKKDLANKSLEVMIQNDMTNLMDSYTAKGRNTSIRNTTMIKNLNIRPSLAPPRDSIGFSDGTRDSSAEGSGWDSHRTTRKTLRQTFGKDFTPRKSLRALVLEKSAKRQTEHLDVHSDTARFPQANSTEFPEDSNRVEDIVESDHELSRRTRQTTLEAYLKRIKQQNIEKKHKMEEAVRSSLKGPARDTLSLFKVPNKPAPRRPKPTQNKPKKQIKSIIPLDDLPSDVIEDMKYKPPKRYQPTNASWITKRLYKFLETKLEAKYDYKARVRAEKLVETIYHFAKDLRRHDVAPTDAVEVLKHELARLDVVHTHFEFYEFFHEFMPREVRVKVVPDIVNKIPLPRHGVFSDILLGNTVHG